MLRFVSHNIGLSAITKKQYIERHVTDFANRLYNPKLNDPVAIAYIDGIKPALVVASDEYILDIYGPYFSGSRNNDASMLENEFQMDAASLGEWFRNREIFTVDRGNRNVLPLLENLGIHHKMPALLQPGQQQLEPCHQHRRLLPNCRRDSQ